MAWSFSPYWELNVIYILTQTGSVIFMTTVQRVTNMEVQIDDHKALFGNMIQKSSNVLKKTISRLKGISPILKIGQNPWSLMKTFKKSSTRLAVTIT